METSLLSRNQLTAQRISSTGSYSTNSKDVRKTGTQQEGKSELSEGDICLHCVENLDENMAAKIRTELHNNPDSNIIPHFSKYRNKLLQLLNGKCCIAIDRVVENTETISEKSDKRKSQIDSRWTAKMEEACEDSSNTIYNGSSDNPADTLMASLQKRSGDNGNRSPSGSDYHSSKYNGTISNDVTRKWNSYEAFPTDVQNADMVPRGDINPRLQENNWQLNVGYNLRR